MIIGAPGSGKSTQGQKLAASLGCPWISTGEILRQSEDSEVIEKLKTAELFDDEMIIEMVKKALSGVEDAVIDGFPRTKVQAEAAARMGVTDIVELFVPREETTKRLSGRGREQDSPKVVEQRITDYEKMREEVLEAMNIDGNGGPKFRRVDGRGTIEEVFDRLREEVK